MGEIASSLVAVVLVMCSVFIPAAFLPGTTGQLYKQFAITIVISVSVSGFIALTVTPAMCAVMLKHNPPPTRGLFAWFNRQVDRVTQLFGDAVDLRHQVRGGRARPARGLPVLDLPPVQDPADELRAERGPGLRVRGDHHAAGGEPRAHAGRSPSKADAIFKDLPGVQTRTVVTGYSLLDSGFKTNAATIFVTFTDFDKRYENIDTAKKENARAILQGFFAQGAQRSRARS